MEATIVDVLENFLDELTPLRVKALSQGELEELAEAVNAFYEVWAPEAPVDDELLLYSGGWVAGNVEAQEARQYLYTSLLYAPSVVIHDPVADWFDPNRNSVQSPPPIRGARGGVQVQGAEPQLLRSNGYYVFRDEPERSRTWLIGPVGLLAELAPLIRAGVVVPVPQWRIVRQRQVALLTAVRHDIKDSELAKIITERTNAPPPRSDQIRGAEVTPPGGIAQGDELRGVAQNPSYFLNKTLAIADATSSHYVPPGATDAALLDYRIGRLAQELGRKDIDMKVVASLANSDLPFLSGVDAATILAIRRDESSFADWRANLRSMARTIETLPSAGEDFVREAREILSDSLLPAAKAGRLPSPNYRERTLNSGASSLKNGGGPDLWLEPAPTSPAYGATPATYRRWHPEAHAVHGNKPSVNAPDARVVLAPLIPVSRPAISLRSGRAPLRCLSRFRPAKTRGLTERQR